MLWPDACLVLDFFYILAPRAVLEKTNFERTKLAASQARPAAAVCSSSEIRSFGKAAAQRVRGAPFGKNSKRAQVKKAKQVRVGATPSSVNLLLGPRPRSKQARRAAFWFWLHKPAPSDSKVTRSNGSSLRLTHFSLLAFFRAPAFGVRACSVIHLSGG